MFVCDVDRSAIERLPSSLTGSVVDVGDPDAVADWLEPIVASGVDILVNNAGIAGPTGAVEDISVADWRRCLAVDLDAMFYTTRLVVPAMKASGAGVIVNIASTAGLMGMPLRAPYVAAKFGVIGLTKTLAMELGPDSIRVNAIAPGSLHGERMERVTAAHAAATGSDADEIRASYLRGVSMARFIDPDEVAAMIIHLCSAAGRSISGQVIAIDGHTETLFPR